MRGEFCEPIFLAVRVVGLTDLTKGRERREGMTWVFNRVTSKKKIHRDHHKDEQ